MDAENWFLCLQTARRMFDKAESGFFASEVVDDDLWP